MAERTEAAPGRPVGRISHYFGRIGVGAIKLTDTLRVGDTVRITGHTTDLTEVVQSMQLEHATIQEGVAGQEVAIKVSEHVREGDEVFVVEG